MGRTMLPIIILFLSAALPILAEPQQQESLGDLARQLRAQKAADTKRATKVYTNDNLPASVPGEALNWLPPTPEDKPKPAPTITAEPAPSPSSETTGSKPSESPQDGPKTRDDWQGKFKAARQDLAKAKELQQLSEDELNLLQIQQVREIDPAVKANLTGQVQAKQSEVDVNKAATDAAQKALENLEKEFKARGAPDDWNQTE
jgi:hypothetical protein